MSHTDTHTQDQPFWYFSRLLFFLEHPNGITASAAGDEGLGV